MKRQQRRRQKANQQTNVARTNLTDLTKTEIPGEEGPRAKRNATGDSYIRSPRGHLHLWPMSCSYHSGTAGWSVVGNVGVIAVLVMITLPIVHK